MLVLSRKTGQRIQIGPDTEVMVLGVQGNKVRLGISAPTGVKIWRAELISNHALLPAMDASCPSMTHSAAIS